MSEKFTENSPNPKENIFETEIEAIDFSLDKEGQDSREQLIDLINVFDTLFSAKKAVFLKENNKDLEFFENKINNFLKSLENKYGNDSRFNSQKILLFWVLRGQSKELVALIKDKKIKITSIDFLQGEILAFINNDFQIV